MIYFILAPMAGLVKIGYSKDPQKRFDRIVPVSPVRIDLMGVVDGDGSLERRLHTYFFDDHVRSEWFQYTPRVSRAITSMLDGSFDHSELPKVGTRSWALAKRATQKLDELEADTPSEGRAA